MKKIFIPYIGVDRQDLYENKAVLFLLSDVLGFLTVLTGALKLP